MIALRAQSRLQPTGDLQVVTILVYLQPHFVIDPIDVKIIEIFLAIPASIEDQRAPLMKCHGRMLSGRRVVSLEFLPFPIVRLKIETPQPREIRISLVIFTTEDIHHVIVDRSCMGVYIAERVVVQKVCLESIPLLIVEIVTVGCLLLSKVILSLH